MVLRMFLFYTYILFIIYIKKIVSQTAKNNFFINYKKFNIKYVQNIDI